MYRDSQTYNKIKSKSVTATQELETLIDKAIDKGKIDKNILLQVIKNKELFEFARRYPVLVSRMKDQEKWELLNQVLKYLAFVYLKHSSYRPEILRSLKQDSFSKRISIFLNEFPTTARPHILKEVMGDEEERKELMDLLKSYKKTIVKTIEDSLKSDPSKKEFIISLGTKTYEQEILNEIFNTYDLPEIKVDDTEFQVSFKMLLKTGEGFDVYFGIESDSVEDLFKD